MELFYVQILCTNDIGTRQRCTVVLKALPRSDPASLSTFLSHFAPPTLNTSQLGWAQSCVPTPVSLRTQGCILLRFPHVTCDDTTGRSRLCSLAWCSSAARTVGATGNGRGVPPDSSNLPLKISKDSWMELYKDSNEALEKNRTHTIWNELYQTY